jgi:hypothetical protein
MQHRHKLLDLILGFTLTRVFVLFWGVGEFTALGEERSELRLLLTHSYNVREGRQIARSHGPENAHNKSQIVRVQSIRDFFNQLV